MLPLTLWLHTFSEAPSLSAAACPPSSWPPQRPNLDSLFSSLSFFSLFRDFPLVHFTAVFVFTRINFLHASFQGCFSIILLVTWISMLHSQIPVTFLPFLAEKERPFTNECLVYRHNFYYKMVILQTFSFLYCYSQQPDQKLFLCQRGILIVSYSSQSLEWFFPNPIIKKNRDLIQ